MPPKTRKPVNKPDKTRTKILKAMEKVVESALGALAKDESLSPKEQKEIIALLMKAASEMAKIAPPKAKPFTPTPTDKALLEIYVTQRIAGALPSTV